VVQAVARGGGLAPVVAAASVELGIGGLLARRQVVGTALAAGGVRAAGGAEGGGAIREEASPPWT
jgi:hypothetical protein